jgi:hypothetical protein
LLGEGGASSVEIFALLPLLRKEKGDASVEISPRPTFAGRYPLLRCVIFNCGLGYEYDDAGGYENFRKTLLNRT